MAEVVDAGEKRDTRGRRIERAEQRAALIQAYRQSGLTQRAFAQREGIKFHTFTTWLARARPAAPTKVAFAEVAVKRAAPPMGMIEVALRDGTVVRGNHPDQVVAVVERLRRC